MLLLIFLIQVSAAAPYEDTIAQGMKEESVFGLDVPDLININFPLGNKNITELSQAITIEADSLTDMDECKLCSDIVIPTLYNSLSIGLARIILEVASNGTAMGVLDCVEAVTTCHDTCADFVECMGCVILPYVCAEMLVGEAILMTPLEVVIHSYLMKSHPPYYVCEEAGYCSGAVTRQL